MIEANESFRFIDRGQLTPGLFIFRFHCAGPSDSFAVLLSPDRSVMNEAFESRLRMLKAQIEVTGKNIEQYMGVQHLVYVDDATGLYNTRYLNYILDREIAHAQATKKSFAVLFIDADKFKGINDSHGHLVGTKLLHELGEELKKYVRRTDTVFRYGGDEFVAVLAPCDLATAKVVAERIRDAVEHKTFLSQEGLRLHFTVSIGVALFPDHATSKKSIIDAADHAMYAAKRTTRNSVTIAELSPAREAAAAAAEAAAAEAGAQAEPRQEPPLEPAVPLVPSHGQGHGQGPSPSHGPAPGAKTHTLKPGKSKSQQADVAAAAHLASVVGHDDEELEEEAHAEPPHPTAKARGTRKGSGQGAAGGK
jgi:diguanylate cyclase (GGDEF)-like protein